MSEQPHGYVRAIVSEREGDVHARQGVTVRSRGREIGMTMCDVMIAGTIRLAGAEELTCEVCREALERGGVAV